ncbi:hypothetical protein [Methanocella arvoryzae]|nr:hypothetical protein [Methanocella arvoryzae]
MAEIKNPLIAAVLSFIVPGWGQVYNGQGYLKGLMFMIGELIGLLFFIVPGLIVWVYGIYSAYKVADNINKGLMPAGKEVTIVNHVIYLAIFLVVLFAFAMVLAIIASIVVAFFTIGSTTVTTGPEIVPSEIFP